MLYCKSSYHSHLPTLNNIMATKQRIRKFYNKKEKNARISKTTTNSKIKKEYNKFNKKLIYSLYCCKEKFCFSLGYSLRRNVISYTKALYFIDKYMTRGILYLDFHDIGLNENFFFL